MGLFSWPLVLALLVITEIAISWILSMESTFFFKNKVILARTRGSKGPEYIIDQRFLHAVNMYIMKNIISLVLKKLRGGGGSIEYFLQTSKRHYTGAVPWQKLSATSNGTEKWSPGDRNSDSL